MKQFFDKLELVMCLTLGLAVGTFPYAAQAGWEKTESLPSTETPVDMVLCAEKADCYFAATAHQVFKNEQKTWQPVFNLPTPNDAIMRLRIFPASAALWIQTKQGIFRIDPEQQTAERVYEASDPEKSPLSFFMDTENFWVGTASGLWFSNDLGKSWKKRSDLADHQPVSLIAKSENDFFFAADGDWLKTEKNSPRKLFRLFTFEDSSDDLDVAAGPEGEKDASDKAPFISFYDYLKTDKNHYLASLQGVFKSTDGITWSQLSNSGFRNTAVSRIAWDEKNSELLAVTNQGVFRLDESNRRWKSQNDGLARLDVRAILILPNSENFIAANSEGIWRWDESVDQTPVDPDKAALFNKLAKLEPSPREIHKRVMKYSDTSNGKIKRWHTESRLAALAPSFSLGKDWGISNNIDLDRAGTSDPDRFISGPWNKDRGVDLDLSWDFGDFIFSSSQTSIDSRAKLTVDLRNDLLSEATRLYYERRRLQAETIHDPAQDEKTHLDRLLRIDELTALLDALTGGWLSEKLVHVYQYNPELEELWKYNQPKA